MNRLLSLFLLLAICRAVKGATIQVLCQDKTACHPGQCCYIKPEFEVASKRDLLLTLPPPIPRNNTGICENYKHRGDSCYWLEKMNGHCGCQAGLSCKWIPLGIPPTVSGGRRRRRGPELHTGPGSYQCA